MAKKQKPLKRTPLKRTPLKKKEYNPDNFKSKENSNENPKKPIPLKRTPLKRTPIKRKEYNAEDFKSKENLKENPKKPIPLKRTPLKQTPLKRKEYNVEDFKNKDNSNENPKRPIPLKPTPSNRKEYNSEEYKNKENTNEYSNDKPKKEYPKKNYKKQEYKKKEYKVKDYREYKKREPKPFIELTTKEAFLKLAAFCAYQERCYQEIYAKLEEWKIPQDDHYAIVTLLEEEKFLNEKRFAESYTRGKFSYKKWGKRKIRFGLLQKNISETMIQDAFFSEIEDKEYFATLTELLETKWSDLLETESDNFKRKVKATNYALQKGYENELIREILDDISKTKN